MLHIEEHIMEVTVEFTLAYPYSVSLGQVQELSSLWGLRFVKASTHSRLATVILSHTTYQRMFLKKPKKGEIEVPFELQSFIASIRLTSVK